MSTASQPTPVTQEWWQKQTPAHTSDHITNENYTLVVGYDAADADKEDKRKKAYPEGDEIEEKIAKGEFIELFRQTSRNYFPSTLDGVNELIPDDEEKLNLLYNQLKVKQVNRFRSLVTSKDFTPVEFTIDMFAQAGLKSERRLTAYEKTEKAIFEDFSPEMQKKLLEKLMALQGK